MIDMRDELLFDFSVNSSRVMVTDKLALIDNIIKIVDFSETALVLQNGKRSYTSIKGKELSISSYQNSRIICSGRIDLIEFIKAEGREEGDKE